jgi:DNA polymerase-3 subunit beta
VLSNILIEVDGNSISMSGTDLDIAVSVNVPAEVDEPGSLTVPAKKLQELARELPEHPVRITTKGDRLELTCGRATFRLNGMPRDEFPTFPGVDFSKSWKVGGRVLQELIRQTSFAVSTEESRPILNGVLWQLGDAEMRMVATNGHRLARIRVASDAAGAPKADLIVPPKALAQVERLFSADDESEVARSENHIGFRKDGTQVFTRLIEGPYPNYEQVIPKDNDKRLRADKERLSSALRRMAVMASDQTHRVRLSMTEDTLKLFVSTPDVGEGSEEMMVSYEGDPIDIGFNANYLLEVLRFVDADEVEISLKAPERAALVQPAGADGEEDYLCLVMPLRLQE